MKVAIYTRVSTDDKSQDTKTQLTKCQELCETKGWKIVDVFSDDFTGKVPLLERPSGSKLGALIQMQVIDGILFYSSDRYSREDPVRAMYHRQIIEEAGVKFLFVVNITPENVDKDFTQPIEFFDAWGSRQYIKKVRRDTIRGLDGIKKEIADHGYHITRLGRNAGKRITALGRPPKPLNPVKVFELREAGYTLREIGKTMGVSHVVIYKFLKRINKSVN